MSSDWVPWLLAHVRAASTAAKRVSPSSPWGSKDHKCLLQSGCKHSFGSEDDKRLVPTCCRHSFWSEDYERIVSPAVGTRSTGFRRSTRWSKYHKWLVHTCHRHSFGSKDEKRLVPTESRHSPWSKDDERLVPLAVGPRSGGLRLREGGAPTPPPSSERATIISE